MSNFKLKGEVIGTIIISINHKGRVAGVEIEGKADLCTRQTLKSAMSLIDTAILHSRSRRKKSGLDKMRLDKIKENKLADKIQKANKPEVKPASKFITKKEGK